MLANCYVCHLTVHFPSGWHPKTFAVPALPNLEPGKKTAETTRYAVNIFQEYLTAQGLNTSFEVMSIEGLNRLLASFYTNVRSRNGDYYSRNSLMAIRQGIRRHLQKPPYFRNFDIVTDTRFQEANNALKNIMRVSELNKALSSSKSDALVATFDPHKLDQP